MTQAIATALPTRTASPARLPSNLHSVDLPALVTFLHDLDANNNRPWFQEHKRQYIALHAAFESMVQDIITLTGEFDAPVGELQAKDCIFRIYRDLRFAKDKSHPYKPRFSVALSPGGKDSSSPTYFFQVNAEGELGIAGGLYTPQSAQIEKIRADIAAHPDRLKSLIHNQDFQDAFGDLANDRLRHAPRGYSQDHPEIDLLKLKGLTAWRRVATSSLTDVSLPEYIVDHFRKLHPLLSYIRTTTA